MKYIASLIAYALIAASSPAGAAELAKTYTYFSIHGNTLDDIERELNRRGPNVATTGRRHPGATRMEFKTKLTYANNGRRCKISDAEVRVEAKVILPRWNAGTKANADTKFVWGALSSDIKRHEEQHVAIAEDYARDLERALKWTWGQKTCALAAAKAAEISKRVLDKHDKAQRKFDEVEAKNFEKRLLKLMESRMKTAQAD